MVKKIENERDVKKKQLKPLAGMTLYELQRVTESLGMPKFTAKQLADWL